ncbi:glycosyltransferase family 2 protein [bacterium]|nr:glycosyltransferase family 2 protein [bacterium]
MRKLTAAMIVRNEEDALPACLDSLADVADELVVIDTGSDDGTPALLSREAAADRFERVEVGRSGFGGFGAARRLSLDAVRTGWVLWIDADERLTPGLRRELSRRLDDGTIDENDLWRIPFDTYVLGRRMRCRELEGQRRARLFRAGAAAFSPSAVHEGLVPAAGAKTGDLAGRIEHHTMTSWRGYLRKTALYARLEAGSRSRAYAVVHMPVAFVATFWRQYAWRECWRDGRAGFVWAFTSGLGAILRDWRTLTR